MCLPRAQEGNDGATTYIRLDSVGWLVAVEVAMLRQLRRWCFQHRRIVSFQDFCFVFVFVFVFVTSLSSLLSCWRKSQRLTINLVT